MFVYIIAISSVMILLFILIVEVQLYVNKPAMASGSGYPANGSITVSLVDYEFLGFFVKEHVHIHTYMYMHYIQYVY